MSISNVKSGLGFSSGIQEISFKERQQGPSLPAQAKRIIYYTLDAAPSNLTKIFRFFNSQRLLENVCRPAPRECENLAAEYSREPALAALNWLATMQGKVAPELYESAETVLRELAEIEMKGQVQRNLLKQV